MSPDEQAKLNALANDLDCSPSAALRWLVKTATAQPAAVWFNNLPTNDNTGAVCQDKSAGVVERGEV